MFRKLTSVILFALLLVTSVVVLNAQGVVTITADTPALVRLSPEAPINIVAFSGNAGDLVQVQTTALQPDLNPRVSLQSPTQQVLASSSLSGNTASLSFILTETGTYSLLIGGNAGDYLVALSSISTTNAPALSYGVEQEVVLTDSQQVASINIPADGRATLKISSVQFDDYVVSAFDDTGRHIATVSNTSFACFVVTPQSTVIFQTTQPELSENIVIGVGIDCGTPASVSLGGPFVPASSTTAPQTSTSNCVVTNSGAVNVRNGAGTNYGTIGQLTAGSTTPVIARENSEWVQIQSPFGVGYVSTSVVTLSGDCNNLPSTSSSVLQPTIEATQAPNGQPTAAPTEQATEAVVEPTEAPTEQATEAVVEPTEAPTEQATEAVVEPTEAPTEQATEAVVEPTEAPTEQPTEAVVEPTEEVVVRQIAQPDGNYTANINIDGAIVVSDYVSYPDGDTEDTIFYRVDGLNNSVALPGGQADYTVVLTCSGEGTQYIQMEMNGSTYGCGQVASRRVNFDSNNGVIRIRATGGSATYVQWTLNVTAPRVN